MDTKTRQGAVILSDMTLPARPEGVTAAWLTEALAFRYPGVVVTEATTEDIIWGTSTKIRVRLAYNKTGQEHGLPPTLIVKGGFEEHSPKMKEMYINEIRCYRDAMPYVDMNVPKCYYAGSDPDPAAHQSIVIMEDLKPKGARFCSALVPQGYQQVARRLDAMARYHVQTWNSPEFKPGGKLDWVSGRHEGWAIVYRDRYLVPEVWQHYMDSPRGAAVSVRLHDVDRMRRALDNVAEYHKQFPVCLAHGDTHLGNLYEEADGTPGFFDMQLARGPWQLEVTYHLICALDIPDRRAWEKPLLAYYLERLRHYSAQYGAHYGAQHDIEVPDFETAWEAYRRDVVYGLFVFLTNETRFQTESINTAYAARFGDAAIQHDTMRLLG